MLSNQFLGSFAVSRQYYIVIDWSCWSRALPVVQLVRGRLKLNQKQLSVSNCAEGEQSSCRDNVDLDYYKDYSEEER